MLMIRLRPVGKKGQRTYRFIISEKTKDVFGTYLEDLGYYNPHLTPSKVELKDERVKYWLTKGAQPSETVHNLLVDRGLLAKPKLRKGNASRGKKEEPAATPAVKPAEAAPVAEPAVVAA